MVERVSPEVWDILEQVIKEHPVLLNRAPTCIGWVYRHLNLFWWKEGQSSSIRWYVPLTTPTSTGTRWRCTSLRRAQAEARFLMLSANNLLKPQDGKPVTIPTQDMILGIYYLTMDKTGQKGEGTVYTTPEEVVMAYENEFVSLHAKIRFKAKKVVNGQTITKLIETTPGKIIFNEAIPQDLGFVDRANPETMFNLEINGIVDSRAERYSRQMHQGAWSDENRHCIGQDKKPGLQVLHERCRDHRHYGYDNTRSQKNTWRDRGKNRGHNETVQERLISNDERYNSVIAAWTDTVENITNALVQNLDKENPLFMMSQSGARGNINQIRQLAGMRGLMADTGEDP